MFEELLKQGIEIDCSVFPARRAHGGFRNYGSAEPSKVNIDGASIKELPINLFPVFGSKIIFSGGGYFRLMPYPAIHKMMTQSSYVMTYFHPRDFDHNQPVIRDLSLTRKFKSYYGLKGSIGKLQRLINDFQFVDVSQANDQIDWGAVKTLSL